jgi:hypothetical protein
MLACVMVLVGGQTKLPHVVEALCAPGSLARRLDRRQQEADQKADNRDYDQKFNESETTATIPV